MLCTEVLLPPLSSPPLPVPLRSPQRRLSRLLVCSFIANCTKCNYFSIQGFIHLLPPPWENVHWEEGTGILSVLFCLRPPAPLIVPCPPGTTHIYVLYDQLLQRWFCWSIINKLRTLSYVSIGENCKAQGWALPPTLCMTLARLFNL